MKILTLAIYAVLITSAFLSCSDSNFLDKTKNDGSIIMGATVAKTDPLSKYVVFIAQNYDLKKSGFEYFGLCSGAILNSRFIITAAHCAKNFESSRVIFATNTHAEQSTQHVYKITSAVIHENYLKSLQKKLVNLNYDIALLKLETSIQDSESDPTYLISESTQNYIKNLIGIGELHPTITGYGKNRLKSSRANTLPINGILKKAEIKLNKKQYSLKTISINQHYKAGVCSGNCSAPSGNCSSFSSKKASNSRCNFRTSPLQCRITSRAVLSCNKASSTCSRVRNSCRRFRASLKARFRVSSNSLVSIKTTGCR